jgi:ribosomal protein S18 acetylase RimI-like enzyme
MNLSPMSPDPIEITAATLADAAEILALQKLCYRSEAELTGDFEIPPLLQTQGSIEQDFARQCVLKAVFGDVIIGSVRAHQQDATCYIGRLIVRPDIQNRGLGKRLMARIEAEFPGASRFELFTGEKSERNRYLYGRLGYRVVRTEPINARTTLVFMEKIATETGRRHPP